MTSYKNSFQNSPKLSRYIKSTAMLLSLGFLAACAGAGDITRSNPDYFLGKVSKETNIMSGLYNPLGYNASQVEMLVRAACPSGDLEKFDTQAGTDAVPFSASCQGGFRPSVSLVEFERMDEKTILLEVFGSNAKGDMVMYKKQVSSDTNFLSPN